MRIPNWVDLFIVTGVGLMLGGLWLTTPAAFLIGCGGLLLAVGLLLLRGGIGGNRDNRRRSR